MILMRINIFFKVEFQIDHAEQLLKDEQNR